MKTLPARILKKMGYFADRRGIAERFLDHAADWDSHLKQTRDFVLSAVTDRKINNLAILGSGWLLDLPPEEVSHIADHVYLYDIVHPPQTIHKIMRYGNISAVTNDLTGGAVWQAYLAVRKYRRSGTKTDIVRIVQNIHPQDFEADYIVSLNVLSQLGSLICEYLIRHIPYSKEELDTLNRMIQSAHIQLLRKTRSCLVTDYEEVAIGLDTGNQEVKKLVLTDIPASGHTKSWDWKFDAGGGYYPGKKVILKVLATEIHPDDVDPPRRGIKETR